MHIFCSGRESCKEPIKNFGPKNRCRIKMISEFIFDVLLIFAGLVIGLTKAETICKTADCQALSNQILSSIQESVNPCDDFYQYACGTWIAKNPVPKGVLKWSHLSKTLEKVKNSRLDLLTEPISPNDPSAVKAAKTHFKACIDEKHTDAIGLTPLLNIIQQNGGWPILESNNFVPKKTWQQIHNDYISRMGDGALFKFFVFHANRRAINYSIILDQPNDIAYQPVDYSNKSAQTNYIHFIKSIVTLFTQANGSTVNATKLQEDAQNLYQFQKAISKIKNPENYRKSGPKMTIKKANSTITKAANPGFDLLTSLQGAFGTALGLIANQINDNRVIRIREMNYMQKLMELLQQTPANVIINYIHLHFVQNHMLYSPRKLRNLVYDLYKIDKPNRMTICAKGPMLKRVLSYMYINRYFNEANRTVALDLIHDVKKTVELLILESGWLNNAAKTIALQKLHNVVYNIGYDKSFVDIDDINAIYAEYNIGNSVLQNVLNYKEIVYKREIQKILKPIDWKKHTQRFEKHPAAITPSFHLKYNKMEIPAGFLSSPFFSTNLPKHANLATAGATAAYLFGSLYDDLGWYFDKHGNLSMTLRKMQSVNEEHDERMKCFAEQYIDNAAKEVPHRQLQLNPDQPVLFETIYDSFALKIIMNTYMNTISDEDQRILDTENFSKVNELFLAFANPYCESVHTGAVPIFLEDGLHTIAKLRVNIAVSNLPEFSQVYHCDENAAMNPKKKCALL